MKLIKAIYRFIDKRIVLPITRLFTSIGSKLKKVNKPLESLLKSKSSIIILSLVIAVGVFLLVDKSNLTLENNAEVLYNQPVTAVYNNEEYVIEGLPKTVDITMIGSRANLYLAKQLSSQSVTVDLSDLKPGTHQVNLKYKQAISNVEYKLDPSTVSVTISTKQSLTKEINTEITNLDKLDSKYSINSIKLTSINEKKDDNDKDADVEEISSVIVKGKESVIKEVATVKALININELSSKDLSDGETTIKAPLVAYDSNGEKIDVELVPSKVNAIVNLESSSKEVPINIVVKNIDNIKFGKAIESLDSSIDRVTIYGSTEALESINKVDVEINIPKDLDGDKKFTQTIKKPNGVRELSSNTISVDLKLGDQATTEVQGVKISYRNLDSGFLVQATQDSTTEIPVIVTGVESVIKNVSASDVEAYVDLKNITSEGEVTVEVNTTGSDNRVKYSPRVKEVKLLIIKK